MGRCTTSIQNAVAAELAQKGHHKVKATPVMRLHDTGECPHATMYIMQGVVLYLFVNMHVLHALYMTGYNMHMHVRSSGIDVPRFTEYISSMVQTAHNVLVQVQPVVTVHTAVAAENSVAMPWWHVD